MLTFGAKCLLMLVSVIIPCYNVEAYVARALDSALAQTHRPLEIIAVDNNSTDGTLAILRQYEQRYPELITVLQEPKQGAPAARNLGLRHAKGEWLQFLDADDVILPGKVGGQVGLVEAGVDYVAGAYESLDLDGTRILIPVMEDPVMGVMEGLQGGSTISNLWRKASIEGVAGWKESLKGGQDIDLMMRLLIRGATVKIDHRILTQGRQRPSGQITQSNPPEHLKIHIRLRHDFINDLKRDRPDYFAARADFFYTALFKHMRMLGGYDSEAAIAAFKQYMPKGFKLKRNDTLHIGTPYTLAFNCLGYSNTERLKNHLKRILPEQQALNLLRKLIHQR